MFTPDVEDYHIVVTPGEQGFMATVVEIGGLRVTKAKTEQSARTAMRSIIRKHLKTKEDRGEFYPFPQLDEYAAPFIWRIYKQPGLREGQVSVGGKPSYILGTVHYPDKRLSVLPEGPRKALEQADSVWTEMEFDHVKIQRIADEFRLPEGTSLEAYLSSNEFMLLRGLAMAHGWDFDHLKRLRPMALLLWLTYSFSSLGRGHQLDELVADEARRLGKEYRGLETIEEQKKEFQTRTDKEMARIVGSYLQDYVKVTDGKHIEPLFYWFLKGAERRMEDFALGNIGQVFSAPGFYGRNRRMAKRIDRAMKAEPDKSFFFSCGVGHCLGPCSIPDLLDFVGWTVQRGR